MSNRKARKNGGDSTQPETADQTNVEQPPQPEETTPVVGSNDGTAENPRVVDGKPIDLGEAIVSNTDPPSDTIPEEVDEGEDNPSVIDGSDVPPPNPETIRDEGEIFNPDIHCQNEDGSPRLNKDGSFRKRKKKRVTAEPIRDPYEAFTNPPRAEAVLMVKFVVDSFVLVAVHTFGDEWKLSDVEHTQLTTTWARYAEYRGWLGALRPEVALIGITATILMPRIMHPNFMGKINQWRNRRKGQNAHSNIGADKIGKDNHSQGDNATGEQSENAGPDFGPNIFPRVGT